MKKLIALLTVAGFLTFGMANMVFAQNEQETDETAQTEEVVEAEEAPVEQAVLMEDADETPQQGLHYVLKEKYIQGGALWMTPVLICLILGLALVIERVFYLNLASVNSDKLLKKVEDAIQTGGIEKAKELCRNTKGPLLKNLLRHTVPFKWVASKPTSAGSACSSLWLRHSDSWVLLSVWSTHSMTSNVRVIFLRPSLPVV